jgi:DNA-binding LacI/PurR family transcriptional regulator
MKGTINFSFIGGIFLSGDLLYMKLKNDIISKIYEGIYVDGEAIPSERVLADEYNISRVTVRKAMELLESDGIIQRKFGKGTIVSLNKQSYNGNLDIIALVAPAQRRFFATFIDYFQKIADKNNALVVFVQQSEHESIEDTIFKLLQKNIHNVVIWLDYKFINSKYIQSLRGLGMNTVFFDITIRSDYADCVCLDNRDAIVSLYNYLKEKNDKGIVYVSRDTTPSSYNERNQAFRDLSPSGIVWSFPWDFKNYLANHADEFVFDHLCTKYKPSNIICSDGELGIALKKELIHNNIHNVNLVSLDDFDECAELGITVYKQPYKCFAEKIFHCLEEQNFNHLQWKAGMYRIKGELIVR